MWFQNLSTEGDKKKIAVQERVLKVLTILTSKFLKFLSVIVLVLWLPDESGVSHGDGE